MPWGLKRYQQARHLHFITFSCYHRAPRLRAPQARDVFVAALEQARRWYGFYVVGYVVMPEHVHLLISELQDKNPSAVMQALKLGFARRVLASGKRRNPAQASFFDHTHKHIWQKRFYDFNVWTEHKCIEKLRYIHRNPVTRGLVERPEDWPWSSFRHYMTGEAGVVEIESKWTAGRRERMGISLPVRGND